MRARTRRLTLSAVATFSLVSGLASCADSDDESGRTKNAVASPTAPAAPELSFDLAPVASLPTPVGPDRTLTAPDGVSFGTRVAVDRAMIFASTRARPTLTKGAVYASSFSDQWSAPREIVSSWDFHFGRDIDVNNHNVIASAADTRSGLFGDRTGDILIGTSPQSAIVDTSPRLGVYARSGDDLGAAVALSDSYMAVSAPAVGRWTTPAPVVFIKSLTDASSGVTSVGPGAVSTNETFGTALDMDDSTLVVGASGALTGDGAVFIFSRSGATWNLAQRLDGTNDEAFGSDVTLVGSRMVVGAPGAAQGAVHVCERTSGTWSCPTRIPHPDASATGLRAFGAAVDLSSDGTELVVGAPWGLGLTCCPGAAFTYTLRDGVWGLAGNLQPTSPANNDGFGDSVAIDGGVIAVGAPRAAGGTGTVSVFGSPAVGARAPRAAVAFTNPTAGAAVNATINLYGDAPSGYDGSLQAWDRRGNSWRSTFDANTTSFGGNWPDADSAYGSLTVFNQFGYDTAALSTRIATPTPTTATPTTASPTSSVASLTMPPTTPSVANTPAPESISGSVPGQSATPTTSRPQAGAVTPSTTMPTTTMPTTTKPETTTKAPAARPAATTVVGTPGISPTSPAAPSSTSLTSTCRVGQPCVVEIPALLGGKTASMRGAPAGLRYNVKSATISGVARKRGSFSIVVKAGANGKTATATVNLTVK